MLISNTGDALICDFGLSRMIAASRSFAVLKTEIKGTAQYLAYELIYDSKSKHTAKTDVWAFGMTVFVSVFYTFFASATQYVISRAEGTSC